MRACRLPMRACGCWSRWRFISGPSRFLARAAYRRRPCFRVACAWSEPTALYAALAPLWDLYAFVVWIASYMSNEVRWRDRRLMIGKDGRLAPLNSI